MPVKANEVETIKATAKELVERSAAEEGNISYSLNGSTEDPCLFAMIECWKDQAVIDLHNNTEHFTGILPRLFSGFLWLPGLPPANSWQLWNFLKNDTQQPGNPMDFRAVGAP